MSAASSAPRKPCRRHGITPRTSAPRSAPPSASSSPTATTLPISIGGSARALFSRRAMATANTSDSETKAMTKAARMRHCFYCGAELGVYANADPLDSCGKPECERAARDEERAEREEAHRKLDEDRGWS